MKRTIAQIFEEDGKLGVEFDHETRPYEALGAIEALRALIRLDILKASKLTNTP